MSVTWFGKDWGAPVCKETKHAETPIGAGCLYCEKPIEEQDQGVLIPYVDISDLKEYLTGRDDRIARVIMNNVVLACHLTCFTHSIIGIKDSEEKG